MSSLKKIFLVNVAHTTASHPLVTPPIGLLSLAAWLRERFPFEFTLLDMRLNNDTIASVVSLSKKLNPVYIGLSAFSTNALLCISLSKALKTALPYAKIILGGPYITTEWQTISDELTFDAGVLWEGEITSERLFTQWENNAPIDNIPNLVIRKNNKVIQTGLVDAFVDVNILPIPAYDLIDFSAYAHRQSMSPLPYRKYMSIMTSRGCPYHCLYCHNILGKRFRAESPDRVVAHIEYLAKTYMVTHIEIIDDAFNANPARVEEICGLLQKQNLQVHFAFPNGLRGDLFTENTAVQLQKIGTEFISFAPETGSQKIQKSIHKNMDLVKMKTAIAAANKHHIFTNGFFMLGFPGETVEDIKETIRYARTSQLHTASFYVVTLFRNTGMYEQLADMPDRDSFIPHEQYQYAFGTKNLAGIPQVLFFSLLRSANLHFYILSPLRLFRIFRDYPGRLGLLRYVAIFLQRLFFKPPKPIQ